MDDGNLTNKSHNILIFFSYLLCKLYILLSNVNFSWNMYIIVIEISSNLYLCSVCVLNLSILVDIIYDVAQRN